MTRKTIAAFGVILCIALLASIPAVAQPLTDQTTTFLNVGQGDSALLQDGAGFNVLVDGGKPAAGPTVVAYLRDHEVTDLDVVVVTHADADHAGGLIDVFEATDIQVHQVLYNGYPGSTPTWTDFVDAVTADGLTLTPAQYPQEFTWGLLDVSVLNPATGLSNPETNRASLVLKIDYGQVKYLFTGDIDTTVEATVIARTTSTPMAVEILKVTHHGSAYGSSAAFLTGCQPEQAMISVGPNSYGHPDEGTLDRLADSGASTWRTDWNGVILVSSDGTGYTITAEITEFLFLPVIIRDEPAGPSESTPVEPFSIIYFAPSLIPV